MIVHDGPAPHVRRAGGRLLLPHADERELPAPGDARGRRGGHPARHVPAAGAARTPKVQLLGSGTILREVLAAAELLRDDFGVEADVWSATSFTELRRDGHRRRSAGTCCTRPRRSACPTSRGARRPRRPGGRGDRLHPRVRRPDPAVVAGPYGVLGTDGFGRSDYRERCAAFFEVDRHHVALAALKALATTARSPRTRPRRRSRPTASTPSGPRRGRCRGGDGGWHRAGRRPGHRRLRRRRGDRGAGRRRRRGRGGGPADHARVRQGDDGGAVARRRQVAERRRSRSATRCPRARRC